MISHIPPVMMLILFCSRAMGDGSSAVAYFDESVNFLSKVQTDDLEVQII